MDGMRPNVGHMLLENGYEPILLKGKAPVISGWNDGFITPERYSRWEAQYPYASNTGLRTGALAVTDIDLWNSDHTAEITEVVCDVLGDTLLRRVGQKGVALLFYNPDPTGKSVVQGMAPDAKPDDKPQRVEFLGTGQQIAAFGLHPDTGRPYDWLTDSLGGTPLDTQLNDLPTVSPELIQEAAKAVCKKLEELGFTDVRITGSGTSCDQGNSKAGEWATAEMLENMLAYVDPGCERSAWIAIAGAIKSTRVIDPQTGEEDDEFDGATLFDCWSAGELNPDNEPHNYEGRADCDEAYNSVSANRPGGAGLGTIRFRAQSGGYDGAVRLSGIELLRGVSASGGSTEDVDDDLRPAQTVIPDFKRHPTTGAISKTFPNALVAARHMEALPELDEFNHRVVFRGSVPWADKHGRVLDDDLLRAIRVHFLSEYGLDVSKENVSEAVLTVAASNRFHPVQEYLSSLEWDGKERIDSWLVDYFGAADTPYVRAVGRKTMIGAVARAFEPGIKFDTMLVLQGSQGIGKSTGIRKLTGDDWFCDGLPGDLTKADAVQVLQGSWIVELSELEGFNRSQTTTIKAFLSRQGDRARFAYERYARDYPRQCIFIASTNESAFLRDPTGGRRFWPVNVTDVDIQSIDVNRDQLWAEAVEAFRDGEDLVLPQELWTAAAREQEVRHNQDPWVDILRDYLDAQGDPSPLEPTYRVHASFLLVGVLGIPKDRQTSNHSSRLRGIMENRLGWKYRKSVKVSGKTSTGYIRLDDDPGDDGETSEG